MAEPSYFSDFLDLADNKNINSIPDAYASIGAFANLPAEQVANAMSGVFNPSGFARDGQQGLNQRIINNIARGNTPEYFPPGVAQPQMTEEEKIRQYNERMMIEEINALAGIQPFNPDWGQGSLSNQALPSAGHGADYNPALARALYSYGDDEMAEALEGRTGPAFYQELKDVRKATEKAEKDWNTFQQYQAATEAAAGRDTYAFPIQYPGAPIGPSYGQVDTFGVPTPPPPPFQQAYNPVDAGIDIRNAEMARLALSMGGPQYSGGVDMSTPPGSFLDTGAEFTGTSYGPPPLTQEELWQNMSNTGDGGFGIQNVKDIIGNYLSPLFGGDRSSSTKQVQTSSETSDYLTPGFKSVPKDFVFQQSLTGTSYGPGGQVGEWVPLKQTIDADNAAAQKAATQEAMARYSGTPGQYGDNLRREQVIKNWEQSVLRGESGYIGGDTSFAPGATSLPPTISQLAGMQPSQVAPFQTQDGITGLDTRRTTAAPSAAASVDDAEDIIQTGVYTAEDAMKALSQDDRYKDVFNEDGTVNENASKERAIAIIDASSQGQSIQSKVNMKKNINFVETPVEGKTESFDNDGNLVEGGKDLYVYRNGEWIYRGERGNLAESDNDFFARIDDQIEDVPSAPPSALGVPSFQPNIQQQYGQQMGQPYAPVQQMQQGMGSPATYGEVLGGTPMQPMTTTGGFYDDLYQQSLKPVDAFKQYQLSQFPGASLGSRLAAQDALGTGFTPAFGRFLLGSASGRIAPQEGVDASSGFGGYLRDRQRADLSQVRQEFANLGGALRGYAPGGTLDQRFPSYYETFGDPSDPTGLKSAVLQASQAALGTRKRTGALGNIYDVMEQQYGTGGSSRFADFISGAFNQQPMMQSFATNTSPYQMPGFEQYNPINRLGATTAASARVQPTVQTYQPLSGFNTKLTNQLYGPAGIAQG